MTKSATAIRAKIQQWWHLRHQKTIASRRDSDETPLRAELFSSSQMEEHGKVLAGRHHLGTGHASLALLHRLAENEDILVEVRDLLLEVIKENRSITPAGEWLLDNFYLVAEQIQVARRLLPKGYAKGLPRLQDGPSRGLPRVYDLALETISHGDGRVDPGTLASFVAAYQTVTYLQLGELWAIPIMLRLALIENLRRVAARIAIDRDHRNLANYWANKISETAELNPKGLILIIADMARSHPPMVSSFVAELARRLQGQGSALALSLTWIEQQLSESSLTIGQLVQAENQQQAADQLSISNSIGSLRFLSAMNWRQFVETMSAVEHRLSEDPAGVYSSMDFATRDSYRHVIEKLAKKSKLSEEQVAHQAIRLAEQQSTLATADPRTGHVGYYLLGEGLTELQDSIKFRTSFAGMLRRQGRRFPLPLYLGAIFLLTLAWTFGLLALTGGTGPLFWLVAVLLVLAASQVSIAMVNLIATRLTTPRPLPRMDYKAGIPTEMASMVIIPSMLINAESIGTLVDALEVRYLANRDDNLSFGLLTDFKDAASEHCPEDAELLAVAEQGIIALNQRYQGKNDAFFLFHRPRQWNDQEGLWMGYERKRGKLAALNLILRGGSSVDFSLIVGDLNGLPRISHIITLDTDTDLPRDSARQLVAAMAHPLNRALYDPVHRRIVAGYGILQPRVAISLPGTNRSRYAQMWGGEAGIDPYTLIVSDLYQDVFAEGSFIGKGIYAIDAFDQVLKDRFPENLILSHDLVEGCYARSGLISDVQLFEEYPASYLADVSRRHRWIRGDWQIIGWLRFQVAGPDGQLAANPLSALSQWKIFDNLRRSLVPLATALLFLLAWIALPRSWWATAAILTLFVLPALLTCLIGFLKKSTDALLSQHLRAAIRSTGRSLCMVTFNLICLPYEAYYSSTAIFHTLWRLAFARRGLLSWQPSSAPTNRSQTSLPGTWRTMWIAPTVAAALAISLGIVRPNTLTVASPILLLWFFSPLVVWWISKPIHRRKAQLSSSQLVFLGKLSRRTWAFFDTFVGPDDHWLPPDNFQEDPLGIIAHRTSPTNIGLALLADLAAHDFGYLSLGRLLSRTGHTFATMAGLERYRGHFYNWYDTVSLNPLLPKYVSAVDSGNLAASLFTLRAGLLALANAPLIDHRLITGLADTLLILVESSKTPLSASLVELISSSDTLAKIPPTDLAGQRQQLGKLVLDCRRHVEDRESSRGITALPWAKAMVRQSEAALLELDLFVPWAEESTTTPIAVTGLDSLRQLAECTPDQLAATCGEDGAWSCHQEQLSQAIDRAKDRLALLTDLAGQAGAMAEEMQYPFLYDETRHLLAIGYNVSEGRRDESFYDLLASEARLSSFVAIAQGQLPQESWFALGRLLTSAGGEPLLLSWSGSMFEYLMPLLVMPTYEQSLLDHTCKAAVTCQIDYGRKRGIPWGISESCYNMTDSQLNYQYKAFGVPGLGLKRGLAGDLVIAPYATALALMVAPEEACRNLEDMSSRGFQGQYGFYDAIDYTPTHLPHGQSHSIVRAFMAHHQGMTLLSLANLLLDRPMQKRFAADPTFQATLLLLQERLPKASALNSSTQDEAHFVDQVLAEKPIRVYSKPDSPIPEVQLLSNGSYHVMITSAGGGSSRWRDLAVTRWQEDSTRDNWGSFCYIRDVSTGNFWSAAHQPTLQTGKRYEAIFSEGRAEFRRQDEGIDTHTAIAVSPEDDIELRRITLTNVSAFRRTIELTSYAEVVLSSQAADRLHPAFSNLFVQTEILRSQHAILATRRPRSGNEKPPWMFHTMVVQGAAGETISYETDRLRFIGRGNSLVKPAAMIDSAPLSGSEGSVLDPIVAIRCLITLEPETSATVNIVTGAGESRELCTALIGKYQDSFLADRVFELAWTHSQVLLRQINATETDAQLYGRLAASVLYSNEALRADPALIGKNRRGQSGLWGYSISGDLPIVLLRLESQENIGLFRQLIQAHAYWRLKGLVVDLVVWNEEYAGYRQGLHDQIMGLIAAGSVADLTDQPGGIFIRNGEQISEEDRILFQAVARIIISDSQGSLAEHLQRRVHGQKASMPNLSQTRTHREPPATLTASPRTDLMFFNGTGGFTPDGREYVISTDSYRATPAPWINVLANPQFGTIVSENGAGYTWSENAHEYRLTPWQNDPVIDGSSEAFYLRDEERGHFWSPMPQPAQGTSPYVTRHGFGYTVFEHQERGIRSEVWVYVAMDAPIKFTVVKVKNQSGRNRRLSVSGYVEWVLGDIRTQTAMHVTTAVDAGSGAVFARNPYNADFADRVGFFNVDHATRTITADRTEFIGRNGTLAEPAAMGRTRLSGRIGAALDPCAALQVAFDLEDGEEREIVFTLGAGRNSNDATHLAQRWRDSAAARKALEGVWHYWRHTLDSIQVETPDQSINFLVNGWLLYQTISCRMWGRSGYYQSGGAFGFRDQLQDSMALVHAAPDLVRAHLLTAAGRQFSEGDVQHWWHPPMGRGVRTHCSDDFLWLPLATCRYVLTTGDTGILAEPIRFIKGRPVNPEEDSYYELPELTDETASLYNHCVRAIRKCLHFGDHGLPLIGSGDWNDGMNMVGHEGKGESLWLAFFICDVLRRFSAMAELRDDGGFVGECQMEVARLRENIELHGWDGAWYRRAYFDNGSPLGSATNTECRIDSIAQSWSVLSEAAQPDRARQGMAALDHYLVRREDQLIQLLDPPFDTSELNPGYIKGYVPGVRENGGQYTHAAIWATMAFAKLGDHQRAWELLGMINPVNHGDSPAKIAKYKVEPYVVAADVYAVPPHTGRGGWTWYTGSAAWLYRCIVESLLGISREGDILTIAPCLPADWQAFTVHYRFRASLYHLRITASATCQSVKFVHLISRQQEEGSLKLIDDGLTRDVEVVVPRVSSTGGQLSHA